jgi:hypothetical protein
MNVIVLFIYTHDVKQYGFRAFVCTVQNKISVFDFFYHLQAKPPPPPQHHSMPTKNVSQSLTIERETFTGV